MFETEKRRGETGSYNDNRRLAGSPIRRFALWSLGFILRLMNGQSYKINHTSSAIMTARAREMAR